MQINFVIQFILNIYLFEITLKFYRWASKNPFLFEFLFIFTSAKLEMLKTLEMMPDILVKPVILPLYLLYLGMLVISSFSIQKMMRGERECSHTKRMEKNI